MRKAVPFWRTARSGDGRRSGWFPNVIKDVANHGSLSDESDDAHRPTAQRADERKDPVESGQEHGPRVGAEWGTYPHEPSV